MLSRFIDVNKNFLDKKFLVAVSGGVDSMVLLQLLISSKCSIEVAHVDHNTRSGQSALDAQFVKNHCKALGITYHQASFRYESGNFQAEARRFRKYFFQEILQKRKLDLIATAHHIDDVIEGYLLASFRGTHLNRLVTPKHHEETYIRPLYFFEKGEIEKFASDHSITFVQDESNSENNYSRNYLRNEILPLIIEQTSQGKRGMINTIKNLTEDLVFLQKMAQNLKPSVISYSDDRIICNLSYLKEFNIMEALPHLLREYGFSSDQITNIPISRTGSIFETDNYTAVKDRKYLLIHPKDKCSSSELNIHAPGVYIFDNYQINVHVTVDPDINTRNKNEIHLPLESKPINLEVRYLRPGDKIRPLNLKGKSTKISKALTDLKIDRISKQQTIIFKTPNEVVWAYPFLKSFTGIKNSTEWLKITIAKCN